MLDDCGLARAGAQATSVVPASCCRQGRASCEGHWHVQRDRAQWSPNSPRSTPVQKRATAAFACRVAFTFCPLCAASCDSVRKLVHKTLDGLAGGGGSCTWESSYGTLNHHHQESHCHKEAMPQDLTLSAAFRRYTSCSGATGSPAQIWRKCEARMGPMFWPRDHPQKRTQLSDGRGLASGATRRRLRASHVWTLTHSSGWELAVHWKHAELLVFTRGCCCALGPRVRVGRAIQSRRVTVRKVRRPARALRG